MKKTGTRRIMRNWQQQSWKSVNSMVCGVSCIAFLMLLSPFKQVHLLRELSQEQKAHFEVLGASCHSVEDALEAQSLGCTYITAGHVFETDCKKGLPGRGLDFLRNVCAAVDIPVYGIGGIDADNIVLVREAGASGACLMSSLMVTENVSGLLKAMEGSDEIS